MVHREGSSKSVRLMTVVLTRQNSGKDHMRRLCTRKDAPEKQRGIWRKINKLKNLDKTTLYTPIEAKVMPAEFVVDSGASMHMMSKTESSSEEMGTIKRSSNPTAVLIADGDVHTHEEAQEFVHDLNQFVTVQLLEETPTVLSLGKLCKDHGYSTSGSAFKSHDWPQMGKASFARQTILHFLSFQGYLSILEIVRLLLRHHQNRWDQRHLQHLSTEQQQAHPQIQCWGEVTKLAQGNLGRNLGKTTRKIH